MYFLGISIQFENLWSYQKKYTLGFFLWRRRVSLICSNCKSMSARNCRISDSRRMVLIFLLFLSEASSLSSSFLESWWIVSASLSLMLLNSSWSVFLRTMKNLWIWNEKWRKYEHHLDFELQKSWNDPYFEIGWKV